jgi:signal transduction histidine kinase
VDAQAAELRRIERDLHDGAQARIVSLGMTIGLAEELIERDPAAARKLLAEARESSSAALVELRHLVRGIHPPVLAERGLDGAVRALALSLPIPITVDIDLPGRPDTPVESAAYFVVAEALANVSRHSAASTAWVRMRHADGVLFMTVGDDGIGRADPAAGTGLRGIERRLAAFDGTIALSSPPGGPTVVTMELPCALSSPKTSLSSGTD